MSQLKMKCPELKPADVLLKPGFSIIDSSSGEYTEEQFSKAWASICEELNEKYDETLYRTMMLEDQRIPDDAILFVKAPDGNLISTAAVLMTENPHEAVLHMVGTKQTAKGQGAGGAVSAACINYAIHHQIQRMSLRTDEFRIPAIKIYYKLGFRPDLYQPDMRERWIWVMKELGWKEFDVVNESGVSETIVL